MRFALSENINTILVEPTSICHILKNPKLIPTSLSVNNTTIILEKRIERTENYFNCRIPIPETTSLLMFTIPLRIKCSLKFNDTERKQQLKPRRH